MEIENTVTEDGVTSQTPQFKASVKPTENIKQYMKEYRENYKTRDGVSTHIAKYKRERRYEKDCGLSKTEIATFSNHIQQYIKLKRIRQNVPPEVFQQMLEFSV
jgi:hypothetical protein